MQTKLEKPAEVPKDMWETAEAVARFISKSSPGWIEDEETLMKAVMNKLVFGGLAYRLDSKRRVVSSVLFGITDLGDLPTTSKGIGEIFWDRLKEDGDALIVDKMDGIGSDASIMLTDILNMYKNVSTVMFVDRKDSISVMSRKSAMRRIALLRIFSNQRFKLN